MFKTRLAPSPTGALHLGNARTFLVNWLLARRNGWRIALRIEDLDAARARPGLDQAAMDDLRWLGIDWDEGPTYQLGRMREYDPYWQDLLDRGLAYPCICTRQEATLAGSAPHVDDGGTVYPGTCRGRFKSLAEARAASGRNPTVRFQMSDQPITFIDGFRGTVTYDDPGQELGDFIIARADGSAAYQLAVVVDDALTGVTHVVRGDDLVASTPRQIAVYRALGLMDRMPTYIHLPLLVGPDGKRLAKRHGDTRITQIRAAGASPQRVLGLLARQLGFSDSPSIQLNELLDFFDLSRVSRIASTLEQCELTKLMSFAGST